MHGDGLYSSYIAKGYWVVSRQVVMCDSPLDLVQDQGFMGQSFIELRMYDNVTCNGKKTVCRQDNR